jgi:hypothetical protein
MKEFEPLIGEWQGEGKFPIEPPMKISADVTIERLGKLIVFRSVNEPAEFPDSIAVIGGAPDGESEPMHSFDDRWVKRMFLTSLEGSIWRIWRAPGEDWLLMAGRSMAGGSGMGESGDECGIDVPIKYVRKNRMPTTQRGGNFDCETDDHHAGLR